MSWCKKKCNSSACALELHFFFTNSPISYHQCYNTKNTMYIPYIDHRVSANGENSRASAQLRHFCTNPSWWQQWRCHVTSLKHNKPLQLPVTNTTINAGTHHNVQKVKLNPSYFIYHTNISHILNEIYRLPFATFLTRTAVYKPVLDTDSHKTNACEIMHSAIILPHEMPRQVSWH